MSINLPRSNTALGPRDRWSQPLSSYVNLIEAMPHPAAVFWGPHLVIAHNIAWGSAASPHDIQGAPAADWCQGEARGSLQSALTGRTVRVGKRSLSNRASRPYRVLRRKGGEDVADTELQPPPSFSKTCPIVPPVRLS